MLLLVITKYLIALTIFVILLFDGTNAQLFTFRSFNDNFAGDNSLNNNANAGGGRPPAANQQNQQNQPNQANQAQQNPWLSALGAGVQGFIAGSLFNRGLSSGNLPAPAPAPYFYGYGGYYPYYGGYYYPRYYRYPYYYYYYG
ncbi:hypothetical protein QQG55_20695 [Brugia pahangi]